MQPNDSFQIAYRCTVYIHCNLELPLNQIHHILNQLSADKSNIGQNFGLINVQFHTYTKTSQKTNARDFEARVKADAKSCKFCKKRFHVNMKYNSCCNFEKIVSRKKHMRFA